MEGYSVEKAKEKLHNSYDGGVEGLDRISDGNNPVLDIFVTSAVNEVAVLVSREEWR